MKKYEENISKKYEEIWEFYANRLYSKEEAWNFSKSQEYEEWRRKYKEIWRKYKGTMKKYERNIKPYT